MAINETPLFSGENPEVWISQMEQLMFEMPIAYEQYVEFALQYIEGTAKLWIQVNKERISDMNWCDLVYNLLWEFKKEIGGSNGEIIVGDSLVNVIDLVEEEQISISFIPGDKEMKLVSNAPGSVNCLGNKMHGSMLLLNPVSDEISGNDEVLEQCFSLQGAKTNGSASLDFMARIEVPTAWYLHFKNGWAELWYHSFATDGEAMQSARPNDLSENAILQQQPEGKVLLVNFQSSSAIVCNAYVEFGGYLSMTAAVVPSVITVKPALRGAQHGIVHQSAGYAEETVTASSYMKGYTSSVASVDVTIPWQIHVPNGESKYELPLFQICLTLDNSFCSANGGHYSSNFSFLLVPNATVSVCFPNDSDLVSSRGANISIPKSNFADLSNLTGDTCIVKDTMVWLKPAYIGTLFDVAARISLRISSVIPEGSSGLPEDGKGYYMLGNNTCVKIIWPYYVINSLRIAMGVSCFRDLHIWLNVLSATNKPITVTTAHCHDTTLHCNQVFMAMSRKLIDQQHNISKVCKPLSDSMCRLWTDRFGFLEFSQCLLLGLFKVWNLLDSALFFTQMLRYIIVETRSIVDHLSSCIELCTLEYALEFHILGFITHFLNAATAAENCVAVRKAQTVSNFYSFYKQFSAGFYSWTGHQLLLEAFVVCSFWKAQVCHLAICRSILLVALHCQRVSLNFCPAIEINSRCDLRSAVDITEDCIIFVRSIWLVIHKATLMICNFLVSVSASYNPQPHLFALIKSKLMVISSAVFCRVEYIQEGVLGYAFCGGVMELAQPFTPICVSHCVSFMWMIAWTVGYFLLSCCFGLNFDSTDPLLPDACYVLYAGSNHGGSLWPRRVAAWSVAAHVF